MQHSQRLDQRLHMLREEVRTMTQEKERGEQVWRERLQRCQRQLKAKEEEMSRQSQYFENFKTQLQHKLSLARDREQSLQNRIYALEKQLLDMTVSAATGMATISAVRITAGTVTHWVEQERLTSMRGEGEGEEERKEERRKQCQPSVGMEREGGREGDEGKTEKEREGGRNKETKQSSNEARLQVFILSLQEDLRVLLEREEDGMTERRGLMEQLQEAQENSQFLGSKVEEMKAEVHQLKLSESSLMEEVEELRDENHRFQQILREAANQTPSQPSKVPESACPSPGTSSPSCSLAVCPGPSDTQSYITAMGHSSVGNSEVQPTLNGRIDQSDSSAVLRLHHQGTAESAHNNTEDHSGPVNLFAHSGSKQNLSFQSPSFTTETIDEFKLGTWCSRGLLNLEESPSEESDALREAYRSLGLGQDFEALREQRDHLEAALQHTQEQLEVVGQENTQLKLQLRKQAEEPEGAQGSPREKIGTPSTRGGADHLQSSPTRDNTILALAQDDLVQGLNQENRALADRIQELLAHIELREEDIKMERTQLREHTFRLEEDRARHEQENQEQGCLITELTRKTEDDLNTIMELQQKLEESGEQINQDASVDSLVESVLKGKEEPQLMSSQQPDDLSTASSHASEHYNYHDPLQSSPQNTLHVSSLTGQVDHLIKTVQSLKTEQDELTGNINSLRQQQGEVALSVQTQTEEKQQLTRTVWGLKEEKDRISQCLAGLKQERQQLTRTVCGLKDERDHFIRSMSDLKEEKEQLIKSLSGLEREKEALTESLSSGKEERDRIMRSLQSLQTESEQLRRAVLTLKQEREEVTISFKSLKEQRDREQSSYTLQDDRDKLIKSVGSLREEKEGVENSITCLKQEEKQIMFIIQGLREERSSFQSTLPSQTQTEERQQLLNPNSAGSTKKTETLVGTGDFAAQRCQTNNYKGISVQEQSDRMREIEALGAQLQESREQLDKSHEETKKLYSELSQSEARREEAERKAADAAEKVMRLTDVASQMEETRRENEILTVQVKELKGKLTGLVREKTDALSLKTQIEEQYNILTAQLKAKTVALEELNSEYIALKRGQGSKDDLSTALMSLRTRYNDIRAKYDALLKKKSQTDLDVAPLKAKLSCLVVKCQERNNLLVQMLKAIHRQGCVDSMLTQQVEQLLSDTALQEYTAAFTPGSVVKTGDYSAGFTPRFISKFQDYSSGFKADQTCAAASTPAQEQHQNGFTSESGVKCRDFKSEKHISIATTESNLQDGRSEVSAAPTGTLKKNANSPVPTAPVQENASVAATPVLPALKDNLITNKAQLSASASRPIQAINGPEKCGFHHPDVKGKSSPDLMSSAGSSLSPIPPSSSKHVGPSRRLSSPEKIINLHEQLQKTLMSSYQKAPVSRGRGHEPRKSLSFSAPADLNLASQTNKQSLSFYKPHSNSLPATTASSQPHHSPVVTPKPAATNKSTTLFNAVASRSANVTFNPNIFTYQHLKADVSKTTASALSSSSNCPFAAMAPNEAKSTSNSGTKMTISPKVTKQVTTIASVSDARHTASTPLTLRTTTYDSNVLICSDTNSKTSASDMTAPGKSTAPNFNISNGAAPPYDGLVFTASGTQSAHRSPERSNKSARRTTAAQDKTKTIRPGPGNTHITQDTKVKHAIA
ncbi:centromere-associated protein E isoform X2 [Seriola aureovittata]|uniref:centromere-associated protein E isoform X2 n=1 Tax=Seriola aureovittata TaxID=2871759 RepID=UPI0024BE3751|nr:centromere-associated protein E isoform X2 [Seriola aureovittata]